MAFDPSTIPSCATLISSSESLPHMRPKDPSTFPLPPGLWDAVMDTLYERHEFPPVGSIVQAKEPLSMQATTTNFRRFVQSSGPIFAFQDQVLAVLTWEEPARAALCSVAWLLICFYPKLLFLLPNIILVGILLTSYSEYSNHPSRASSTGGSNEDQATPAAAYTPPSEGSIDYLANLQSIQETMGLVSNWSDILRPQLLYFSFERTPSLFVTSLLLITSFLSTLLILGFIDWIPWKGICFALGEGMLWAGHPKVRAVGKTAWPFVVTEVPKWKRKMMEMKDKTKLS